MKDEAQRFDEALDCFVKRCKDCRIEKPVKDFPAHHSPKQGKHYPGPRCIPCHQKYYRVYAKKHYQQNPDKLGRKRSQTREWRKEKKKENPNYDRERYVRHRKEQLAYHADYRRRNREKVRAANRIWYEQNRERRAENLARWHAKHPDWRKQYNDAYRAQRLTELRAYDRERNQDLDRRLQIYDSRSRIRLGLSAQEGLPLADYYEILMVDACCCYLCHTHLPPNRVSFDHVVPLSRGGEHSRLNLRVCCLPCNVRKSNKLLEELAA